MHLESPPRRLAEASCRLDVLPCLGGKCRLRLQFSRIENGTITACFGAAAPLIFSSKPGKNMANVSDLYVLASMACLQAPGPAWALIWPLYVPVPWVAPPCVLWRALGHGGLAPGP